MGYVVTVALLALAWIGHAYFWTAVLNHVYGRRIPKWFLKLWRIFTGFVILAYPLMSPVTFSTERNDVDLWFWIVWYYFWICIAVGGLWFPLVTIYRAFRNSPTAVLNQQTVTVDYSKELGPAVAGDGKYRRLSTLPFNDVFKVDFTEMMLAVPELPMEWDGLSLLLLSDLHFCGTPSREFFERVIDRVNAGPKPDLVLLVGDYVDTDTHREWIEPLFSQLSGVEGQFAILGNHDQHHRPELIRDELRRAGYTVLGNSWKEVFIRGQRCVMVGHEGPWFQPIPDLNGAPWKVFRLCISHSPDSFNWGRNNRVNLMLCGHVHGGQIRLPLIGSIFVPSIYGRRFDMGVFCRDAMVMVVGRGLSGKEPLRFRCHPQVLRIKLMLG